MAQAYASLGVTVTVLEPGERLLAHEEPFAGEQVPESLEAHGVDVRVGAHADSVDRDGDGNVNVLLPDGSVVIGDEILVAGRRPLTDDLGVETVGLAPGETIPVDETPCVNLGRR